MPRSLRERLAWLAITVFLGFEIRHDFLRLLDPTYKAAFQQDSDSLVRDEMLDPAPVLFPLLGGQERDYTSQFGLQGMVMTWLSPGDHFYEAMRLTTAMLTAAVLALAVVTRTTNRQEERARRVGTAATLAPWTTTPSSSG